jgi:WhiB family redox-sensing transcriptional regulator
LPGWRNTGSGIEGVSTIDATNVYNSGEPVPRRAWVSKALCRSTDPDEFFVSGAAQRRATVICRGCPVVAECLADALDHRMEFGVWGGLTERQRRALVKDHPEVVSWFDFFAALRKHRNTRLTGVTNH